MKESEYRKIKKLREKWIEVQRTVAIVPIIATVKPKATKNQSKHFSATESFGPNNFKCAAAGKMTLTAIKKEVRNHDFKIASG